MFNVQQKAMSVRLLLKCRLKNNYTYLDENFRDRGTLKPRCSRVPYLMFVHFLPDEYRLYSYTDHIL